MKFNPKVSIIIPVYNGANYLKEAIDSAFTQTYKNIEVIVVNDGSKDDGKTEEIAKSYGDKIRYIYQENGGVASALNRGIQEMTGEYFSWLSHDDVYYPDKIEVQIDYLQNEKKDIILYGDYDCIDAESKFLHTYKINPVDPLKLHFALLTSYPVNGCTTLIPKSCFNTAGLFNEKLKTTQDYEMWFKLAGQYEFRHIVKPLVKARLHPEQGCWTIPIHLTERNDLYIWYLQKIFEQEILKVEQSLSLFYIKIAISFKQRGFKEATNYALNLCFKNLYNNNAFSFLKTWVLIIYYKS